MNASSKINEDWKVNSCHIICTWVSRETESFLAKIDICRQLFGPLTTDPLTGGQRSGKVSIISLRLINKNDVVIVTMSLANIMVRMLKW